MAIKFQALSERECALIRGVVNGVTAHDTNVTAKALRMRDGDELIEVPVSLAQDYVTAWRNSGRRILRGR